MKKKWKAWNMKKWEWAGFAHLTAGASVIRLKSIPKTPEDFGRLQHEITHVVMFLLYHLLHTPHNLDTTEAYSYLTQYITEETYKRIFRCRK
jgi:hypothetical protein